MVTEFKKRRSETILLAIVTPLLVASLAGIGWAATQLYSLNAEVAALRVEMRSVQRFREDGVKRLEEMVDVLRQVERFLDKTKR